MKKLAIIDGHYYLHRTLHLEAFATMEHRGVKTGGLRGVLQGVRDALDMILPSSAVFVFDAGLSKRRCSLYPEYKAHRRAEDTEEDRQYRELFKGQRKLVLDTLPLTGVRTLVLDGREGDDVIAAVCDVAEGSLADSCVIVSDDKDLLQLVSPTVSVYRPSLKTFINEGNFEKLVGYRQEYHVLAKAIIGDSSDNIKGVSGVGEKTVAEIFTDYPVVEGLGLKTFCAAHESKRARKVADSWDVVERNVALLDLRCEKFDLESYRKVEACLSVPSPLRKTEFLRACARYGYESITDMASWWLTPFWSLR